MRLYTFVNRNFLRDIQCGIQSAHVVSELFIEYPNDPSLGMRAVELYECLLTWAKDYKTVIVCDGGNCTMLKKLFLDIQSLAEQLSLPYTQFFEDEDSLNNAITAVGIIVPEEIYDMTEEDDMGLDGDAECGKLPKLSAEYELYKLIKSKKLA